MDQFNNNDKNDKNNKIIILLTDDDESCIDVYDQTKKLDVSIITVDINKTDYFYCPSFSQSQSYDGSSTIFPSYDDISVTSDTSDTLFTTASSDYSSQSSTESTESTESNINTSVDDYSDDSSTAIPSPDTSVIDVVYDLSYLIGDIICFDIESTRNNNSPDPLLTTQPTPWQLKS